MKKGTKKVKETHSNKKSGKSKGWTGNQKGSVLRYDSPDGTEAINYRDFSTSGEKLSSEGYTVNATFDLMKINGSNINQNGIKIYKFN